MMTMMLMGVGGSVQLKGASAQRIGAGSASLQFASDGSVTATNSSPAPWYSSPTPGVGNQWWVRATLKSGVNPSSGTLGTWLSLATAQTWTNTVSAPNARFSQLRIELSNDGGTTVVLDSDALGVNYLVEADAS